MVRKPLRLLALLPVLGFAAPALAEQVCVEEVGGVCLKYQTKPRAPEAPRMSEAERGLTTEDRRRVQQHLKSLGHYRGGIDGQFGRGTRRAIADWQRSAGFEASGFLNRGQLSALTSAAAAAPSQDPSVEAATPQAGAPRIDPEDVLVGAKCSRNARGGLRVTIRFLSGGASEVTTDYEIYDGDWEVADGELCVEVENHELCNDIPEDASTAEDVYAAMRKECISFSPP